VNNYLQNIWFRALVLVENGSTGCGGGAVIVTVQFILMSLACVYMGWNIIGLGGECFEF